MARQRQIVLARLPTGVPVEEDFRAVEGDVPEPGPGQFLARTIYLSLDPYLRSAIAGRHIGHGRSLTGEVMPGRGVARVVQSRDPAMPEGAFVVMETGWQEYAVADGGAVRRVDPAVAPLSTSLGVLGMPGLTAWAGLSQLAKPEAGELLVVSAAAGAVGSAAGQIARIMGCRVIGIAGSGEKCAAATSEFGFEGCVSHRRDHWQEELADLTGRRVDVYFDNVGGPVLDTVMDLLALRGRVVLCGLIGQYNTGVPVVTPVAPIIRKRAQLLGLVVYDHEHLFGTYLERASRWLHEGRLRYREDRSAGLDSAPAAFVRLMSGMNLGKSIVVVAPESIEG